MQIQHHVDRSLEERGVRPAWSDERPAQRPEIIGAVIKSWASSAPARCVIDAHERATKK